MKKSKLLVLSLASLVMFGCAQQGSGTPSDSSKNPIASDSSKESETPTSSEQPVETLEDTTLYMIGDSTCQNYDLATKNTSYYYQIQGFGTTIKDYFTDQVEVVNLGVGGASTTSYPTDPKSSANYNQFKNNIKAGDYAIITFGHNDEKTTVGERVDTSNGDTYQANTFQGNLYNDFIKVALDKGATPILATPIARYDGKCAYDEETKTMHVIPSDGGGYYQGDYPQAIRDVAKKYNLTCIDTTKLTGDALRALSADEAKEWYGWPTSKSYDGTHVNIYGAQQVGYMMAKTLKESTNKLGKYVVKDLVAPTKEKYLIKNSKYVEPTYKAPGEGTWSKNYPNADGWHGSAFGNFKSSSKAFNAANYAITKNEDNTVTIEDKMVNPSILNSKLDSHVMYFQKISKDEAFTLEAKVHIDEINPKIESINQTGCGIMVRDDMYIDQTVPGLNSHYAAAGFYGTPFNTAPYTYHAWARTSPEIVSSDRKGKDSVDVKAGDEIEVMMTKNDSTVKTYYKTKGATEYVLGGSYDTDLELTAVDTEYVYAGVFVSGGIKVTFSNINLTIDHATE